MLPSTGYFKGLNCPFYDSGLCERPYCHFRHVKKESLNATNDGIESGEILQKLVSAAVQKVLQQAEASSTTTSTISVSAAIDGDVSKVNTNVQSISKATYNPTPISELNKIHNIDTENNEDITEQKRRHIPVPYTPRKPANISIKRPAETNASSQPFIYITPSATYKPGADPTQLDPYTPKGSIQSNEKYLPGTETELQKYTPKETQTSSKRNYVPSDKNVNKKKMLEYKPIKIPSQTEIPVVTYQPTPRSLAPCFSSDEDEPDTKKRKLSSDLNGFDDLGPEFDILDQILDEEKTQKNIGPHENSKHLKDDSVKNSSKNKKKSTSDKLDKRDDKESTKKNDVYKELSKIDKNIHKKYDKEKSSLHKKDNNCKDKKGHKSSSKDKSREDRKDKSTESKKSSSSKSSENSKHSQSKKKKHSKEHSRHKDISRSDSKGKDKSHHRHKNSKECKDKSKKQNDAVAISKEPSGTDDHEFTQNDDESYEVSDADEETIALECKRIFEEYVHTEDTSKNMEDVTNLSLNDANEMEYVPGKKRISRTIDKNVTVRSKLPVKPDFKVNAAQTMSERLSKIKEYHAAKKLQDSINTDKTTPTSELVKNSHSKIRIAHVPYASTLISAKKIISPTSTNVNKNNEPSTSSTIVQTVKKGIQRVAHVPNEKFIDRPGVLEPLGSKIPANIRSTYLNMMIDECLKIYLSPTDAYARAQHEELATSKKCSSVQIYKNSAVLTVSRLRKELQECNGVKKSGSDCFTLQKLPQTISGKTSYAGSWSIESKSKRIFDNTQEFSGSKLYKNITKWILTEEQLQENGFPRPHPNSEKGRALIFGQNKQKPPKGYIRTCCRCKKDYTVDKKGFPSIREECIYHPNNKYRIRGEAKYQCCSQDGTSDGCCVAPCHVYEYVDFENLKGYVKTLPPEKEMDDYGVYSLDCEMCYTTHGLDLTRVTVINSACKVVYEKLIKPLHPIVDYNTRYSGITEEQMAEVKTTLLEVQATLLAMFTSKTILIGHSLESDFKALKLIHDTVIDTSVLFPHKMGPPYKRALRNLSSEYLKKIIQNSVDGHDSAEDATVCMELIIYKLKEDLKTR